MKSDTRFNALEILYEDAYVLVCVKPHGIATQSRQIGKSDMVNLLKNHIHQSTSAKGEPYLAVIHRLDQPVKGILVFAKSPFAAKELNKQLQHQGFGKYYRALVDGQPPQKESTLEDYMIKDSRTNLSRVCTRSTNGAKLARLHYSIVSDSQHYFFQEYTAPIDFSSDTAEKYTELDIQLDTGRHHQIRVQMAHLGCPIVGDTKYNPRYSNSPDTSWQTICLCAHRLEFHHPKTHKLLQFHL